MINSSLWVLSTLSERSLMRVQMRSRRARSQIDSSGRWNREFRYLKTWSLKSKVKLSN